MKRESEMAYCYSQIIWTRSSPQFHDAQCKLVSPPARRFPFLMGAPQWSCKWDYMWTNGAVRRRQRRPHIAALQAVDGRSSCSSSSIAPQRNTQRSIQQHCGASWTTLHITLMHPSLLVFDWHYSILMGAYVCVDGWCGRCMSGIGIGFIIFFSLPIT